MVQPFQLFKQLTDFYEMWQELYSTTEQPTITIFNFLLSATKTAANSLTYQDEVTHKQFNGTR